LNNFLEPVKELDGPIVHHRPGQSDADLVSNSGYEGAFKDVVEKVEECDEIALVLGIRISATRRWAELNVIYRTARCSSGWTLPVPVFDREIGPTIGPCGSQALKRVAGAL
jgi:hypothetical protein